MSDHDIDLEELVISGERKDVSKERRMEKDDDDDTTITLKFRKQAAPTEKKHPKRSYKVKMVVLDDFEETDDYAQMSKTEGILKIGVERTFIVEDGKQVTFGGDKLSDYVIPLGDEIDPSCFSIYNKNGHLFIID